MLSLSIFNTITHKSLAKIMLMDTKQELIETIKRLLLAEDVDLDFLNKLEENELKTLIVSISDRSEKQQHAS